MELVEPGIEPLRANNIPNRTFLQRTRQTVVSILSTPRYRNAISVVISLVQLAFSITQWTACYKLHLIIPREVALSAHPSQQPTNHTSIFPPSSLVTLKYAAHYTWTFMDYINYIARVQIREAFEQAEQSWDGKADKAQWFVEMGLFLRECWLILRLKWTILKQAWAGRQYVLILAILAGAALDATLVMVFRWAKIHGLWYFIGACFWLERLVDNIYLKVAPVLTDESFPWDQVRDGAVAGLLRGIAEPLAFCSLLWAGQRIHKMLAAG